jgi:hypothetical protein
MKIDADRQRIVQDYLSKLFNLSSLVKDQIEQICDPFLLLFKEFIKSAAQSVPSGWASRLQSRRLRNLVSLWIPLLDAFMDHCTDPIFINNFRRMNLELHECLPNVWPHERWHSYHPASLLGSTILLTLVNHGVFSHAMPLIRGILQRTPSQQLYQHIIEDDRYHGSAIYILLRLSRMLVAFHFARSR